MRLLLVANTICRARAFSFPVFTIPRMTVPLRQSSTTSSSSENMPSAKSHFNKLGLLASIVDGLSAQGI